jgi:hypothetical protein
MMHLNSRGVKSNGDTWKPAYKWACTAKNQITGLGTTVKVMDKPAYKCEGIKFKEKYYTKTLLQLKRYRDTSNIKPINTPWSLRMQFASVARGRVKTNLGEQSPLAHRELYVQNRILRTESSIPLQFKKV